MKLTKKITLLSLLALMICSAGFAKGKKDKKLQEVPPVEQTAETSAPVEEVDTENTK